MCSMASRVLLCRIWSSWVCLQQRSVSRFTCFPFSLVSDVIRKFTYAMFGVFCDISTLSVGFLAPCLVASRSDLRCRCLASVVFLFLYRHESWVGFKMPGVVTLIVDLPSSCLIPSLNSCALYGVDVGLCVSCRMASRCVSWLVLELKSASGQEASPRSASVVRIVSWGVPVFICADYDVMRQGWAPLIVGSYGACTS